MKITLRLGGSGMEEMALAIAIMPLVPEALSSAPLNMESVPGKGFVR